MTETLPRCGPVSFTSPDVVSTVEGLIEAGMRWRPLAGRIIPEFDFVAFSRRYGLSSSLMAADRMTPNSPRTVRATAETILDILNRDEHRRGPRQNLYVNYNEVIAKIEARVRAELPLRIAMPSFAGRPHNLLAHRRVRPDLSELYALQLMKNISDHVRTVFGPGVTFVPLLDGRSYSPYFGRTPEAAYPYTRDLRTLADRIGAHACVDMVEMQDLLDAYQEEFAATRALVEPEIEAMWRDPGYQVRDDLILSMKMRTDTIAISAAAIQFIRYGDGELDPAAVIAAMRKAVEQRARATAFDYQTIQETVRRMELIERAFPDALRGTLHPKPTQYAPYLTNPSCTIAPWHGVPIVFSDGTISTVYESLVYQNHERFRAVYIEGDYEPFFFEEITK